MARPKVHARHDVDPDAAQGDTATARRRGGERVPPNYAVQDPGGTVTARKRAAGSAPVLDASWVAARTVEELERHLAANPQDRQRIVALERAGKNRSTITGDSDDTSA